MQRLRFSKQLTTIHVESFKSEGDPGINGSSAIADLVAVLVDEQIKNVKNTIATFRFDQSGGDDWKKQILRNLEALQLLEVIYCSHLSEKLTRNDLRR